MVGLLARLGSLEPTFALSKGMTLEEQEFSKDEGKVA